MSQASSHNPSLRLFAGDFPELQARFMTEVAAARARDPLAPLVVLVPGRLAGLHLRRELAWSGTSHANIRFCTLSDYARELAAPLLAGRGLKMLPEVARGPLMKRAIEIAGPLHYFSPMAGRTGFRNAAWTTIHELRAAGISADDLNHVSNRGGDLKQKLHDLAAIWHSLDALMQRHKLVDYAVLLELACEAVSAYNLTHPSLIIYGLDDASAAERRLMSSLIAPRSSLIAYLPFRASDAYAWSEPLYIWYLEQGFEAELLNSDERLQQSDALSRVQANTFEESLAGGTLETAPVAAHGNANVNGNSLDPSFLLISAPSRDTEAEEILRETLFPSVHGGVRGGLNEAETKQHRSAILMRQSTNYLEFLRDEWQRAGITSYFHETRRLGDSPSGRALRSLVKLLDGEFRRDDVMAFLLSSPLKTSTDFPAIPATEWNHFSLEAQITAGESSWKENLSRRGNHLIKERDRRASEADAPTAPLEKQLTSLSIFEKYLERLFTRLHFVREAKSWREFGERVSAMFSEFITECEEADLILDALNNGELLDALGLKPNADDFSAFVESLLSQPHDRQGRFHIHEPTIANISDVLGVLFDEVFICGLVEKEFPHGVSQDPLLLDDERTQLQNALISSHPDLQIPLRSRRHLREKFLFRIALNSAQRRVVLSYPRMDPVESREWLPSAFLLRAVDAATEETTDYESLEHFIRTSPQARRVPVNRLQGRDPETSVTTFQYDFARLGMALSPMYGGKTKGAGVKLVADLFCADPRFKRAVEAERNRYRERTFTPFDGCIENDALKRRLAEWIPRLSPSRIEHYKSCPFRYFASHVLELDSTLNPSGLRPLSALSRDGLIHQILETFYRNEHDAGRLPLPADAWPRLEAAAHEYFTAFEREQVTGLFLLWDIERRNILKRLGIFLRNELANSSPFIPEHFNFGSAEPVSVALGNGFVIPLRKKLDRVDMDSDGGARVVDYKTGQFENHKKKALSTALEAHAAQLAVESLGLNLKSFEQYFLGTDKVRPLSISREDSEQNRTETMRQIESVTEHVASGSFFPLPSNECSNCPARPACGSGRFTRKWEFDSPQTESLQILLRGDQ